MAKAVYKKRKVVKKSPFRAGLSLLALYLLALFLLGFFGDRGFIRGYQLYREKAKVLNNIEKLGSENRRLTGMLKQIEENPRIIERKAREDLGLVKRNEMVYLFVPADGRGR